MYRDVPFVYDFTHWLESRTAISFVNILNTDENRGKE